MLKLSRLADYATLLMCRMASQPDQSLSASHLALRLGLPLPTVAKLLKRLAQAQLLHSVRGGKGGYQLARTPAQISLADVIAAIDGPLALTQCISTPGECSIEATCELRPHWAAISNAIANALAGVSLAQLEHTSSVVPIRGPIQRLEV